MWFINGGTKNQISNNMKSEVSVYLCINGGQSKASNQRYDSWRSLFDDMLFVAKCSNFSVVAMKQVPNGSICVNLRFQLCGKWLKPSYIPHTIHAELIFHVVTCLLGFLPGVARRLPCVSLTIYSLCTSCHLACIVVWYMGGKCQ